MGKQKPEARRLLRRDKSPDEIKTRRISLLMTEADYAKIVDYVKADPAQRSANALLMSLILEGMDKGSGQEAKTADGEAAQEPEASPRKTKSRGGSSWKNEIKRLGEIVGEETLKAYRQWSDKKAKSEWKKAVFAAHERGEPIPPLPDGSGVVSRNQAQGGSDDAAISTEE